MPKDSETLPAVGVVPISGRRLLPPPGPIFHLQRAGDADFEIGEFRAWAGYQSLGVDAATNDLAHLQRVISFAGTETAGRTGVHVHLAHAHIVIPTSGRGLFSYDGVVTEAVAGTVIVQHGGTVHDQFSYSYRPADPAETCRTPPSVDAPTADALAASFSFLELFVPKVFANVEIIPPTSVTAEDQACAWDHPYHLPGADFALQTADSPDAAYRPLLEKSGLAVRDAATWGPSGGLVATFIYAPVTAAAAEASPTAHGLPDTDGAIEIFHLVAGEARLPRSGADSIALAAGDTLTVSAGVVGLPETWSPDLRLLRFIISADVQDLRERTTAEIERLEALGPAIITRREIRPVGDARPVNVLRSGQAPHS